MASVEAAAVNVVIRPAASGDLDQIVQLLADDMLGREREDLSAEARPKYRDALAAVIASPENTLFMMEEDGRLIGCLQLTMIPGLSRQGLKRAQIESVRIAADRRGKGLGAQLIRFAIDEAKNCGAGIVQLTTSASRANAHRFYEQLGFEQTHKGFKLTFR